MKEEIIRSHYEPRLDRYKKGYEILDWENEESQLKRFEVLAEHVPLAGRSLLEVGCGVGDLFHFLGDRDIPVRYTGIDLLEKMIERAREMNPDAVFYQGDIFTQSPFRKKEFDIAYCSGIFNLNMGDNNRFLREALPVFFDHAREWVVFNLLDPDHCVKDCRYCFFRPEEVLPWVEQFSSQVELVRDYIPNDFTLIAKV